MIFVVAREKKFLYIKHKKLCLILFIFYKPIIMKI